MTAVSSHQLEPLMRGTIKRSIISKYHQSRWSPPLASRHCGELVDSPSSVDSSGQEEKMANTDTDLRRAGLTL